MLQNYFWEDSPQKIYFSIFIFHLKMTDFFTRLISILIFEFCIKGVEILFFFPTLVFLRKSVLQFLLFFIQILVK